MLIQCISDFLKRLVYKERSPHKLALSFCVGVYIAFSPFLFLHTIMIFLFSWLFALNGTVTFAAAYGVNNPWTMVFIYSADYVMGTWFFTHVLDVNSLHINPRWMAFINEPLQSYLGIEGVSFWAFMIGGNLLGIAIGSILYPVMRHIFTRLSTIIHGTM